MGFCTDCLNLRAKDGRAGPRVAIFGAGIAGLTAAHELVDRGFAVDVFESGKLIGGLAATQDYTSRRVHGAKAVKAAREAAIAAEQAQSGAGPMVGANGPSATGSGDSRKDNADDVTYFLTQILDFAGDIRINTNGSTKAAASKVAKLEKLLDLRAGRTKRITKLPGEHGFRAFHSFYRHVTDTMERIPLSERRPNDERIETVRRPGPISRSVADNLIPTYKVAIALEDNVFREIEYDRRQPRSAAAAMYVLGMWMIAMGFAPSDLGRVTTKLLQFLTSCRERRYRELTETSLTDFLGMQDLSFDFRNRFAAISRFLIAISPDVGDAMTQAMVMCRLLMDPAVSGEAEKNVDRVLNGPTSERWFAPWQFYLSQQNVRFIFRQKLKRFMLEADEETITDALVSCASIGCGNRGGYSVNEASNNTYEYFVSAVPGDALWNVIGRDKALLDADQEETEHLRETQKEQLGVTDDKILGRTRAAKQRKPAGQRKLWIDRARARSVQVTSDPPLADMRNLFSKDKETGRRCYGPWMSGIQFYLSASLTVLPGHIHFPDSKWSLTAVCQSQFWGGDFNWRYGNSKVRSIISVDICDFESRGEFVKKPANRCTEEEIVKEVWFQVKKGLQAWDIPLPDPYERRSSPPIPPPYLDHHLDERIAFTGTRVDRKKSNVEFWIPLKNSWKSRPGPLPPIEAWDQGYRVRLKRLVVVGHFAQTFTSLNIMEAANESARHGVNAILADYEERHPGTRAASARKERCMIWPLEADEPAELDFLKTIDRNLYWDDEKNAPKLREDGKPTGHIFELMQLDRWMAGMFPSLGDNKGKKTTWSNTKLWDSDGWKRFEANFGNIWDKLLTLGRFSTPF